MPSKRTTSRPHRRYDTKRDFNSTPEPTWKEVRPPGKKRSQHVGHAFVIQKHAARRLHYDLRLEIEGAFASWAVPKGLPMKQGERHLAVKVEDHPLEYGKFEGNIPTGNYGAGSVMLWDRGLYELVSGEPAAALRKGHLTLVLAGEKVQGEWSLVRTNIEGDKENWLLIKGKENGFQLPEKTEDRSVLTGRDMTEISAEAANPVSRKSTPKRQSTLEASYLNQLHDLPAKTPGFAAPMKPTLSEDLPAHGDWLYEIKFDGYRLIAVKNGSDVALYSRNGKNVSVTFPEITEAVAALPIKKIVFDGEAVALDPAGISSFQLLQNRENSVRPPIFCYAFDLLNLEGKATSSLPVETRKQLLGSLLPKDGSALRFSAGIEGNPEFFLAQAEKLGLEGIVAKRLGSTYESGRRSRSWLKIKFLREQEFVIAGFTSPKGSRSRFGAILLGIYDDDELTYVARVGTGFSDKMIEQAFQMFLPLRTDKCPFTNLPAPRKGKWSGGLTASEMKQCIWLKPKLVCQVKFTEWTQDDSLRHPVFLGFRDDKPAREVQREKAI